MSIPADLNKVINYHMSRLSIFETDNGRFVLFGKSRGVYYNWREYKVRWRMVKNIAEYLVDHALFMSLCKNGEYNEDWVAIKDEAIKQLREEITW